MEPLGRSQVLAYLEHLARDHQITLLTFEKPGDLADAGRADGLLQECRRAGIDWRPHRYHHRPRAIATAWDLIVLLAAALSAIRRARPDLVHARGYLPAFVSLALKRISGVPFVFDMRAFWPDEMITAGRLRAGSLLDRAIRNGERACLRDAHGIVVLTDAAASRLRQRYGPDVMDGRCVVIPTCVDLRRFHPALREGRRRATRIGSVGSVLSGWFQVDRLMRFLAAFAEAAPGVELYIVTRDDPEAVEHVAAGHGIDPSRLRIFRRTPEEMPAAIAELDAAAMFFAPRESEVARCPTRMGEILACGVPIVANSAAGDVAEIITTYRVGVVADGEAPDAPKQAAETLLTLMGDGGLAERCRQAAEERFSLQTGVRSYDAIYRQVDRAVHAIATEELRLL
ncbi:glycosyltransferase [Aquisalimonas sp.]|uniref:glycosyltransferase n=1 Tax=Aquisalimonas sp. TaxID=1872621 RepID=UPI0025BFB299|nr:glycosyltransferase [Aquisalimonas sp.]